VSATFPGAGGRVFPDTSVTCFGFFMVSPYRVLDRITLNLSTSLRDVVADDRAVDINARTVPVRPDHPHGPGTGDGYFQRWIEVDLLGVSLPRVQESDRVGDERSHGASLNLELHRPGAGCDHALEQEGCSCHRIVVVGSRVPCRSGGVVVMDLGRHDSGCDVLNIDRIGLIPATEQVVAEIATSSPIPDYRIPQQEGLGEQIVAGVGQLGIDVARGIASPLGAITAGAATTGVNAGRIALNPRQAQQALGVLFAPTVAQQVTGTIEGAVSGERTAQELVTSGLGGALGVAGTVAAIGGPGTSVQRVSTPPPRNRLAPSAGISEEGVRAAQRLEARLGVEAPLSAAQQLGSPGLAKFEQFGRRIGSGLTAEMIGMESQQMKVAEAVQGIINASSRAPGEMVGTAVAGQLATGEQASARRASSAAERGAREIPVQVEREIQSATGLTPRELTRVGDDIRKSAENVVTMNRNVANTMYSDANALLGGATDFVDFKNSRQVVKAIKQEATKRVGGQPSPQFLQSLSTLTEIENLPKQSIEAAQRTRSIIGEAIGRMEDGNADAFGAGFKLGDLKRLYGSLSRDIDQSIEAVSPAARDKFREANKFYRDNIEIQEQTPVIRRILNQAPDGGIANTADIVTYFSGGRGKLNDLKAVQKIVSAGAYGQLKRGILDSLRGNSEIQTASGSVVDLSKMRTQFRDLAPEFKRELLGSDANVNKLQAVLDRSETATKALGLGKLDVATPAQLSDLMESIQTGNSKAGIAEFETALKEEIGRRVAFNNDITGRIKQGTLGDIPIDPARLVEDVFLTADRPEVVTEAMRQLTPELQREVQVMAAKTLMSQAMDVESSTLSRIISGETNLKSERIVNLLIDNPKKRAVIEQLIPDDLKPVIQDFVNYRRAIDQAYKQGGGQGLVAASEQMSSGIGSRSFGDLLYLPFRMINGAARQVFNRRLTDFVFSPGGIKVLKFLGTPGNTTINMAARPFMIGSNLSQEGIGYLTAIYGTQAVNQYQQQLEQLQAQLDAEQAAGQIDDEMVDILVGQSAPTGQ